MYCFSGLFGTLWTVVVRRSNPWRRTLLVSKRFVLRLCIFVVYFICLYWAIGIVSLANYPVVILLNYLWPTFTLLFSLALMRQPYRLWLLSAGTTLVVIGICLEILGSQVFGVLNTAPWEPLPYFLAFTAAVCWGIYSGLNRKWGNSAGGADAIPALMTVTGIIFLPIAFFTHKTPHPTAETIVPIVYLCLVPFTSNVCWDIGTRQGNIALLSLLADFIPWVSLTLTAVYLNVDIGICTWISALLIVLGAAISRISLKVRQPQVMAE